MMNSNVYLKLCHLESKVKTIEVKIDAIYELIQENKKNCDKMSTHIDFINTVYEQLKAPINYITSMFHLKQVTNCEY